MNDSEHTKDIHRSRVAILYHRRCPDGMWGAACVLAAEEIVHSHMIDDYDGVYIFGMQYGEPLRPDVKQAVVADVLYIVDFSLAPDELLELSKKCGRIVWVDHHQTAMQSYSGVDLPANVHAFIDEGRSGAVIALEELLDPLRDSTCRTWPVYYVGDRDLWAWALPDSHAINYGMGTWVHEQYGALPEHAQIRQLASLLLCTVDWQHLVDHWRYAGEMQFAYTKRLIATVNALTVPTKVLATLVDEPWADQAYELLPFGKIAFVNSSLLHSEIGASLVDHDTVVCVYAVVLRGNKVTMSWRSRSGEARQIAEVMGGGGHPNAAGAAMSINAFFETIMRIAQ